MRRDRADLPQGWQRLPVQQSESMLRIYVLQHWFNLADLACEEALHDRPSLRCFVGIGLGCEPGPDATALLKFRHLLKRCRLGEQPGAQAGRVLLKSGIHVKTGTIVDATIIAAPSSAKNAEQARDSYRKSGKNDANDAEAICDAICRPNIRCVPPKSEAAHAVPTLRRARDVLASERVALSNQTRGLLVEVGVVVVTGMAWNTTASALEWWQSRLGGITKWGDVRLRTCLIQGARSTMRFKAEKTDRKRR